VKQNGVNCIPEQLLLIESYLRAERRMCASVARRQTATQKRAIMGRPHPVCYLGSAVTKPKWLFNLNNTAKIALDIFKLTYTILCILYRSIFMTKTLTVLYFFPISCKE
jgi:hypothetical protein